MSVESAIVTKLRELSPQEQEEVLKFINSLQQGVENTNAEQETEHSKEASLQKLLEQVTPENLHGELSTGEAVGREIG